MFADDTGIFEPRGIFEEFVENRTREDGSDLAGWLAQLFQTLDTHKDRRRVELQRFQSRLADLRFFDPACGCGNFLIIAYREIRRLELELIRELVAYQRDDLGEFQSHLDVTELSVVNVDQFYGIEIDEFPARI